MLSSWFGKQETFDPRVGLPKNGTKEFGGAAARPEPSQASAQDQSKAKLLVAAPNPASFEEIYQTSGKSLPKLSSGIMKVAEMADSPHLAGMTPAFKQKAVLMALDAIGTDVSEILKDGVARQRLLKEYEDGYLEKVSQFEASRLEQNRREKAELDRITSEFNARIQANLDEINRCQKECRDWQKNKQTEVQRLTAAAALCVASDRVEEVMADGEKDIHRISAVPQRLNGTYR